MSWPAIDDCRSCGARIFFALTTSGKSMPIDAEPTENGNVVLAEPAEIAAALGTPRVRVVSSKNPAPEGAVRYVSHFTTCPNAAFHRRRR